MVQQSTSITNVRDNAGCENCQQCCFANANVKPDVTVDFTNTNYKPLDRPLYVKINSKLQEKIKANEFVDKADILPLQILSLMTFIFRSNTKGNVGLSLGKKKNKYFTIESLRDAFSVLVFSYVLRQ